jgi:hypothetical protein
VAVQVRQIVGLAEMLDGERSEAVAVHAAKTGRSVTSLVRKASNAELGENRDEGAV